MTFLFDYGDGLSRPRAIAMVRAFMSAALAIPTFSVFFMRPITYHYHILIGDSLQVSRPNRCPNYRYPVATRHEQDRYDAGDRETW